MARNHDEISFRDMYNQFLLVKDIDKKTWIVIKALGLHIRQDDNAMLLFGYIDYEKGMNYELLCAACVYDDGEVAFEPMNSATSFKFRYGSFQGDMEPYNNPLQLGPYRARAEKIMKSYVVSDAIMGVRDIKRLDPSRAPGYPDDIIVFFIKEGLQNEGIWCRVVDVDEERPLIKMRMLNEPKGPFGKHQGDIVDVTLIGMNDGELKAVAVL